MIAATPSTRFIALCLEAFLLLPLAQCHTGNLQPNATADAMAAAETQEGYCGWQWATQDTTTTQHDAQLVLQRYKVLTLRKDLLLRCLQDFTDLPGKSDSCTIWMPVADGTFRQFQLEPSGLMDPALQAKYPQIRTYSGQGCEDPSQRISMEITPKGVFAMLSIADQQSYLQPLSTADSLQYITFFRHDVKPGQRNPFEKRGQDR